jgi:hypothetical protein
MIARVDYYVAAIADAIEQLSIQGTRESGECALPLRKVKEFYSAGKNWKQSVIRDDDLLNQALSHLQKSDLIDVIDDTYSDTILVVQDVQKLADSLDKNEPFQRLYILKDNGYSWLCESLTKINDTIEIELRSIGNDVTNPTPDSGDSLDRWEPIELNRSDPDIMEAIAQLEENVRQIAADNGFAAEFPAERDNLVTHAEKTVAAARGGRVTKPQVKQHLYAAGRWLAEKFGSTAIGTFGSELAKWGLRLLGLMT